MAVAEKAILLHTHTENIYGASLSLCFAVICIIDVFGVFPIITLPKTIINCGAYGLLIVTVICSIQIYTATLLGKSWLLACKAQPTIIEKNRYPYSALVELTLGKKLSKWVTILLNVTIFGGGIPNLIVASQNLNLFTIRLFGMDISYCWWILVVGTVLCPILWLGSPKDMKFVCSLSVFAVVSVFLFATTCLLRIDTATAKMERSRYNTSTTNVWANTAIAYGVLSFQFDIHPTILAIQVDMKNRNKISSAVFYGFAGSLLMFLATYMLAYIKLGPGVNSSILESLPTSALLHLSALLVAFQLSLSSAISNSALYQHLEDHVGISKEFNYRRCLLRSSLTLVAMILAECVPQLDLVMSLIGGTLTGPLIFIFPPLIYVKLMLMSRSRDDDVKLTIVQHPAKVLSETGDFYGSIVNKSATIRQRNYPKLEIVICFFVLLTGTIGTFATTYVNIIDSGNFFTLTEPCIYNISLIL